jgi:hypothetical protein
VKTTIWIFLAMIGFLAPACGCNDVPVNAPLSGTSPYVLFPGTEEIPLDFPQQDTTIARETNINFGWTGNSFFYTAIGVFRETFNPSNFTRSITNPTSSEWIWTSGRITRPVNTLRYLDGHPVVNGAAVYTTPPELLRSGWYYWAIWSWDSTGTRVVRSSRMRRFYVDPH